MAIDWSEVAKTRTKWRSWYERRLKTDDPLFDVRPAAELLLDLDQLGPRTTACGSDRHQLAVAMSVEGLVSVAANGRLARVELTDLGREVAQNLDVLEGLLRMRD